MDIPHCLMWCIWRKRNNRYFEDSERTIADSKLFLFKILSDWMSIIGSHSIFSVYDLMDACKFCIWLFWPPAVYLDDSFLCLWIKFSLLINHQKKKKRPSNIHDQFYLERKESSLAYKDLCNLKFFPSTSTVSLNMARAHWLLLFNIF